MRSLFKVLLLAGLSFSLSAQAPIVKEDAKNPQGYWYSRIANGTNSSLHCWVGYSEFYVHPQSYSRWYPFADTWACSEI